MTPIRSTLALVALLASVALAPLAPVAGAAGAGLLWSDSFGNDGWRFDWSASAGWGGPNLDRVAASGAFPTFLRAAYPQGSASPAWSRESGAPLGGGEFRATPIDARASLHLRYHVRFPVGFDFERGGKLPGLFGGDGATGGDVPDGTDGWSARVMWRENGKGEVYAYLPTSEGWGTRIGTGAWSFAADGKWHRFEMRVDLNAPSRADGRIQAWYDGARVVDQPGLKFRTTSALAIDGILFSTFFGGNDGSWASPKTQRVDFAGFALDDAYVGATRAGELAAKPFSTRFEPNAGNAWYVSARVEANRALAGVDARVSGGDWVALDRESWGWGKSLRTTEGQTVQLRARAADGSRAWSDLVTWWGDVPFAAAFAPTPGNAWWVQTSVAASAPPAGVDAKVGGGAWVPLTHYSWGWAKSIHVPDGATVTFRARSADGDADWSAAYPWLA